MAITECPILVHQRETLNTQNTDYSSQWFVSYQMIEWLHWISSTIFSNQSKYSFLKYIHFACIQVSFRMIACMFILIIFHKALLLLEELIYGKICGIWSRFMELSAPIIIKELCWCVDKVTFIELIYNNRYNTILYRAKERSPEYNQNQCPIFWIISSLGSYVLEIKRQKRKQSCSLLS